MANVPYQHAVGSIMHTAVYCRPDVAKAVQAVSQYNSDPGAAHWEATKRIIQYLNTTRDYVLVLGGDDDMKITAYSDSDWANSKDHARSISGYAVYFGSSLFAWSAKKQTSTALSTGEAELYAGTHVGREIMWMRSLLFELGLHTPGPTTLLIDNTSTIRMIKNGDEVSPRTKHIHIAYWWIREAVAKRCITLSYVPTEENVADLFTKALAVPRHKKLVKMLGMAPRTDTR